MFSVRNLGVLLAFVALVLFAASARADTFPLEGDVTFTGGEPPTVTFDFTGAKADGTAVTGSGQFDFDATTGAITNGVATLVWESGFTLDMEFSGQADLSAGTFTGDWNQVGGDLAGDFYGTTDFMTSAHVIFDTD